MVVEMKTKSKQRSKSPADPQPMHPMPAREMMSLTEEDPLFGHSEWVDPEMKQMVSQEERRGSRHSGKTIKRPTQVARTMGS
jgi:hypothetical protein